MVSLSEETSRRTFFDAHEDEDELTESATLSLVVSSEQQGQTISTTWCIFLEIVLLLGLWVCVFILPVLVKDEDHIGQVSSNSLILFTAAGLWFIQLAMDRFYRNQHYRNRLFGYLSFYRRTRNIRRLPLLISSAKLAFLLVTSQVLVDTCGNRTTCGKLARTAYPQIIISISCFIQIVLLVLYSVHTISFNRSGAFPDVNEEEMATSFQHTNTVHSDIGFRDGGLADQVLEKQADMIRYLKKHNEQLSRKICSLSDENKNLRNRNQ